MSRANRDPREGHPSTHPTIEGFVGGSNAEEDYGVVRIFDGHDPYKIGIEGSNVHVPESDASPEWDDPVGVQVEDD